MNLGSKRNMLLLGFLLSLISVMLNSLVIAYVNGRLKAVDDERIHLSDSLERQATALREGDSQFAIYRVMHNLEFAVQRDQRSAVLGDAVDQLQSAMEEWYQSAYDIPQVEMTQAKVEDFGEQVPLMEKDLELHRAYDAATSAAEKEKLKKEGEDLRKQLPEPKSDLQRKLRELDNTAENAEKANSESEVFATLLPLMKSFQAQTAASSEKKRSRISELQDERASLVTRANYASYGALALQMLGLMFILTRDLLSQKKAS